MDFLPTAGQQRLKVLPTVTAAGLETALERGITQIAGPSASLGFLCRDLEDCTWKTALAKHIPQIVFLAPILNRLFDICSNGLIPHAMLQTALVGLFKRKILELQPPQIKMPGWEESSLQYFNLRLRMLASKIRDLSFGREKIPKKIDKDAWLKLQALCLQLNPKFKVDDLMVQETKPQQKLELQEAAPESTYTGALVCAQDTAGVPEAACSGCRGFRCFGNDTSPSRCLGLQPGTAPHEAAESCCSGRGWAKGTRAQAAGSCTTQTTSCCTS
ncbi:unnamed protein product [Symbiodinium microadriaticum]|nr:unnamed protein product [Symbiodinium microadriaticum]